MIPVNIEELAQLVDRVAEWGWPIGVIQLQLMVKDIVEKNGIKSKRFKNNIPGEGWIRNFVRRNNISKRAASNIKRARAKVDENDPNEFFDNLEKTVEKTGPVPSSNIYNYDETNLQDDPGRDWVFVRRGRRRVENVKDHSKTPISAMWCGNAIGELLPPMILYKAKNYYEVWEEGRPVGTTYAATKSGWFHSETFATWFTECFLPRANKQVGPKILLGDNLASHFNPNVVELAAQHDIYFVMLPPNATHIMQPLDVAVFASMKRGWRKILDDYKKETRRSGALPKTQFPTLLTRLWNSQAYVVKKNLISGFRATGLYPLNRTEPLSKLPSYSTRFSTEGSVEVMNNTLINLLSQNRGIESQKKGRGKKVTKSIPGQILQFEGTAAITTDFQVAAGDQTSSKAEPSGYNKKKKGGKRAKRTRKRKSNDEDTCFACVKVQNGDDNLITCTLCGRHCHFQCRGLGNNEHDDFEILEFVFIYCSV